MSLIIGVTCKFKGLEVSCLEVSISFKLCMKRPRLVHFGLESIRRPLLVHFGLESANLYGWTRLTPTRSCSATCPVLTRRPTHPRRCAKNRFMSKSRFTIHGCRASGAGPCVSLVCSIFGTGCRVFEDKALELVSSNRPREATRYPGRDIRVSVQQGALRSRFSVRFSSHRGVPPEGCVWTSGGTW